MLECGAEREEKQQRKSFSFFQWLRSSTPEEEIYQNLVDLETGRQKLKELNSKPTVSRFNTLFLLFSDSGRSTGAPLTLG